MVAKSVLRELLFPLAWYHSIEFSMLHADWMFGLSINFAIKVDWPKTTGPMLFMRPVQVSVPIRILMTDFFKFGLTL